MERPEVRELCSAKRARQLRIVCASAGRRSIGAGLRVAVPDHQGPSADLKDELGASGEGVVGKQKDIQMSRLEALDLRLRQHVSGSSPRSMLRRHDARADGSARRARPSQETRWSSQGRVGEGRSTSARLAETGRPYVVRPAFYRAQSKGPVCSLCRCRSGDGGRVGGQGETRRARREQRASVMRSCLLPACLGTRLDSVRL